MTKNLGGFTLLLAVLLGGCAGSAYDPGAGLSVDVASADAPAPAPADYAAAGCTMSSCEAGGEAQIGLCPDSERVEFVTVCELPIANPTPRNTDCVETSLYGGRVWCCTPPAPAVAPSPQPSCNTVVEQRDGATFQGLGWADHVIAAGTCSWMTPVDSSEKPAVTDGPAGACEAPNSSRLLGVIDEVQPAGAGDRTERFYCGAPTGCILESMPGSDCPASG